MVKEIHFYSYYNSNCIHSWRDTERAIEKGNNYIETTQMGLLSTNLIEKGYHIFVHNHYDDFFEITLGTCERTDKDIRLAHNIFKLWKAGTFDYEERK